MAGARIAVCSDRSLSCYLCVEFMAQNRKCRFLRYRSAFYCAGAGASDPAAYQAWVEARCSRRRCAYRFCGAVRRFFLDVWRASCTAAYNNDRGASRYVQEYPPEYFGYVGVPPSGDQGSEFQHYVVLQYERHAGIPDPGLLYRFFAYFRAVRSPDDPSGHILYLCCRP